MKTDIAFQRLASLPGYRLNEYLLVIAPHEELSSRIAALRNEFAEKYELGPSKWGRPQVTLVSFSQMEMMEERILGHLRTIAMGYPPFRVELKDFGSFPSHTIFINVAAKAAVQALVKEIRTSCQRLMKADDDHKPHFITEPHLSIARKLKPWQYEKGWLEYKHRHFTGRFIASSMTLLKQAPGQAKFSVVQRMEFQNLPVNIKQGELFQ